MDVVQIVNSFHSSNSYILYKKEFNNTILFDCGDYESIINWHNLNNKIISSIFLTHTHFDHIYGLNNINSYFNEIEVYTSTFGKEALFDSRKNLSLYHGKRFIFDKENIITLTNGSTIKIWDNEVLKVFETAGHDKSCLTYEINQFLFTGDSYIPGLKPFIKLPNSDSTQASLSEKLILSRINAESIVCPGHGKIHCIKPHILNLNQ
jgi:hydroxyacylglutathione hydrolase